MHNFHDPIRHLKYLRQSLSQDNEAIGFFLSAGCPLSVTMPKDKWPLIPDVANLTRYVNESLQDDAIYSILLSELGKAEKNVNNIEEILSFLRGLLVVSKGGTVRGLSEDDLILIEKTICEKIVNKINVELPEENTPYHRLCKWIRSIDRKVAVEIFTTNYDLLMEQSLEDMEIPYFDGFVGAKNPFFDLRALEDNLIPQHWSRLWKLHGSINWCQKSSGNKKRVFRSNAELKELSHLIYPSHLKYEESRKMPYLALIDQLNRFIRKKSSFLILSGYSFNDGHINDVIVNALKSNPTAMVLGLLFDTYDYSQPDSDEKIERYPEAYRLAKNQHNLNIWTYDRAIIGTNYGDWRKPLNNEDDDKEILNFIDTTKGTAPLVKFGDFSVFTDFLQKIIGSPKEL
ncbi:SIR2 family protein [Serratia ureilytica]|uniref:SIR2 family protein n=1 Tax=Serratia ureilytica TaxID=300181 RepID=UPI0019810C69|nr:SIR2 family protein [Serratia ureilytica]MBN5268192.1 SIR2 family protein [Serratia ureilytica]